jgi:hypothetical protein
VSEREEQLISEITDVIRGHAPDEVMMAFCCIVCALHRSMGVGEDVQFVQAIERLLTQMLEDVPRGKFDNVTGVRQ